MPEKTCSTCQCNKVCDHNKYGFENCGNYISGDLSPRAEVDLYRKQVDELEDELASTYDKLENAKAEVAREIFEEIKKCVEVALMNGHIETPILCIGYGTFVELKKKYTEDVK